MVNAISCISSAVLFVFTNCDLIAFNRLSNTVQSHMHNLNAATTNGLTGDSQAIQIYKWILTHEQDLTPDMKQFISKHGRHQRSSFPTTQTGIKNYFRNTAHTNRLARYNQNLRSRRLNQQNRVACFVCIGFYIWIRIKTYNWIWSLWKIFMKWMSNKLGCCKLKNFWLDAVTIIFVYGMIIFVCLCFKILASSTLNITDFLKPKFDVDLVVKVLDSVNKQVIFALFIVRLTFCT